MNGIEIMGVIGVLWCVLMGWALWTEWTERRRM